MYPSVSIYKSIQCLVNYTSRRVMQNDLEAVKKCFDVAENLYCNGNTSIRTAIEKVFVYSFSTLIIIWNKEEKMELQSLLPLHLYTAYIQQKDKLRV